MKTPTEEQMEVVVDQAVLDVIKERVRQDSLWVRYINGRSWRVIATNY
jgi:hypothetical protein